MDDQEKIATLRKALKTALDVMEKGMEVRMEDRWPALKMPLEYSITVAKQALGETLADDGRRIEALESRRRHPDECPTTGEVGCSTCSGEYCEAHHDRPCDCDVAARHWAVKHG